MESDSEVSSDILFEDTFQRSENSVFEITITKTERTDRLSPFLDNMHIMLIHSLSFLHITYFPLFSLIRITDISLCTKKQPHCICNGAY